MTWYRILVLIIVNIPYFIRVSDTVSGIGSTVGGTIFSGVPLIVLLFSPFRLTRDILNLNVPMSEAKNIKIVIIQQELLSQEGK